MVESTAQETATLKEEHQAALEKAESSRSDLDAKLKEAQDMATAAADKSASLKAEYDAARLK